jgi:hypothetical protein
MISIDRSKRTTELPTSSGDSINLFIQFYIDSNPGRQKEIVKCLKYNLLNDEINKIYLLNERIYTIEELQLTNEEQLVNKKIVQVNMGVRLTYAYFFRYIREQSSVITETGEKALSGYCILANSDIFMDTSIKKLRYTDIHLHKKMFALLRYDYVNKKAKLFGPRMDSQDTWIFHTNFLVSEREEKMFKFGLGKPGCDNKIIYLMNVLGYEVINDPEYVRTYHLHTSNVRNYNSNDTILHPWGLIMPVTSKPFAYKPFGLDLNNLNVKVDMWKDNTVLYNYIVKKFAENANFVIPRIAGYENTFAMMGEMCMMNGGNYSSKEMKEFIESKVHILKNNAGLLFRNLNDVCEYGHLYMESFDNCELFAGWEKHGNVYPHIQESHDYIMKKYVSKHMFWANALDIFHYIRSCPWTTALRGKKVLIISSFAESINEKLAIREHLYDGVDLFPDCEIITLRPPQTQGTEPSSQYFGTDLRTFLEKIDELDGKYDIALVSCGGYGNLVCSHIFKRGKSAIYVGGVLQMYFGILGTRWLLERGDAVRLYLNEYWSRPKDSEKPSNHATIEKACYW